VKQNAWLQALDLWCQQMAFHVSGTRAHLRDRPYGRYIYDPVLFFEWAATRYPGVTYGEANGVRHMVDFVSAHTDTFNPLWTFERARAEEQKWHAELGEDTRIARASGVPLDSVIDYAPLPPRWEQGHFNFVALQTGKALRSEGRAMHHCVSTYWRHVISGQSRIYSILEAGNRVATLELSCEHPDYKPRRASKKMSRFQVRQAAGPYNAPLTPKVSKAIRAFVEEINKLPRKKAETWSVGARLVKPPQAATTVLSGCCQTKSLQAPILSKSLKTMVGAIGIEPMTDLTGLF
jgi:hypothetical protein